ncbi:hypothetical protein AB0K02_18680 [Streptomyces sp. NPDC049597]|uniref:hypothetical protein n=1 Tax=Streptomyces sp. NPDC049597 TaxID=3155276 RepID=UPI003435D0FF
MKGVSRKLIVLLAVIAIAGAAAAVAYVSGIPPFERRGDITAKDVCETLGDQDASVAALKEVLPEKPEYSFEDKIDGKTVAQGGSSFTADCLVRGEGSVLLSARTQMMVAEPGRSWAAEAIGDELASRATSFEAGAMGVVSGGKAAVLVPCSAPGSVVGGSYSLSVVVHLREDKGSDDSKVNQRLVDLALGSARFAHKAAQCDLPSKIPTASPRLGGDS